jgi:hypothetical protein
MEVTGQFDDPLLYPWYHFIEGYMDTRGGLNVMGKKNPYTFRKLNPKSSFLQPIE